MRTLVRRSLAGAALAGAVWLLAGAGSGADAKPDAWKPILPPDAYKELVSRIAKVAVEGLKAGDDNGLSRAHASAVVIAVATQSVKGGNAAQIAAERIEAMNLAELTKDKSKLAEAKKVAATLAAGKVEQETKQAGLRMTKEDLGDVMNLFRPKAKGGEGLPEVLQTPAPFKTAKNSIEEKIFYLGKKDLKAEVLDKQARELALLGYQTAVIGALTEKFTPLNKAGNKTPEEWRRLSGTMRDAAVQLAEAAQKKDAGGLRKAAETLGNTCTQCHSIFRN